jgi:hypothetical protein
MKLATIAKQPAERFSYTVSYVEALTIGDNLATATAEVSPAGLVVDNVGVYDPRVKLWVSGGTSGTSYKVTLTVNTADGRTFQDELIFRIKEL